MGFISGTAIYRGFKNSPTLLALGIAFLFLSIILVLCFPRIKIDSDFNNL
jgi:hypothetical protein